MSVKVTATIEATTRIVSREEFAALRTGRKVIAAAKVQFINHPERSATGPCVECLQYHRTVWKTTDASRPIAPLHVNCVCENRPLLPAGLTREAGASAPSRPLDPGDALRNTLRRLSAQQRRELLGVVRSKLHDAGALGIDDMVSEAGGLRPLDLILGRLKLSQHDALMESIASLRRRFV